jgi:hypothetical protein
LEDRRRALASAEGRRSGTSNVGRWRRALVATHTIGQWIRRDLLGLTPLQALQENDMLEDIRDDRRHFLGTAAFGPLSRSTLAC